MKGEPVELQWKHRKCMITPFIVRDLKIPGLLGFLETAKLGMVIRTSKREIDVNFNFPESKKEEGFKRHRPPPKPKAKLSDEKLEEIRQIMKSKISKDLEEDQEDKVWGVLQKYQDVWSNPRFGDVKTIASFITTDRPVKDKIRPMSQEMKEEMNRQINELLDLNIIRPSKSAWASTPLFVRKVSGE